MAVSLHLTIGLTLSIAASGCGTAHKPPLAPAEALDPIAFFTGRTHGQGRLDKLFSGATSVTVDSIGRKQGETLILDQTIREGEKPKRVRRWTMRLVGPNRYSGTLTDATSPVDVTVAGSRAYVSYKMKGGLRVRQRLSLQGDGETILNHLEVRKFGARVASLNETIRK